MPDHLHMLVAFGRGYEMAKVVDAWKRYTARRCEIDWQRSYFEHRLRSERSVEEKAAYILQNPVRAGLIDEGTPWPFVAMLD